MDAIQSAVTDANIDEWIRVVRYLLHSQQWRVQMGARRARAIPSRLKKKGEKVQSTDARISAAHTQCVDTRTYEWPAVQCALNL